MQIMVRNIRLPVSASDGEVMEQATKRLAPLLDKRDIEKRYIFRRSVDTRHKTLSIVYSVAVVTQAMIDSDKLAELDCCVIDECDPTEGLTRGNETPQGRPVVVGFGPCGMFAALLLAEFGYRPIVIERGDNVLVRAAKVTKFFRTGELDTETNIQFGAGGAGTFSDGKLVTRINDPRCRYVLENLVRYGAPADVLVNAKPHIGTDKLLGVVSNIDRRIRELGGEIRYNTRFVGYKGDFGKVTEVLCEGFDAEAQRYRGRSYAEAPDIDGCIYFDSDIDIPAGSFVPVRILESMDGDLLGELWEE